MLVLNRTVGQEVVVPECNLVLAVLEVRGDRVRLGISAPTEVHVYRREVWERIQDDPVSDGEPRAAEEERTPGKTTGTAPPPSPA